MLSASEAVAPKRPSRSCGSYEYSPHPPSRSKRQNRASRRAAPVSRRGTPWSSRGCSLRRALAAPGCEGCKRDSNEDHPPHGASVYGSDRPSRPAIVPAVPGADQRLESYARLAVQVGLNLQPGQILAINALIEHAPLARAIARETTARARSRRRPLFGPRAARPHRARREDLLGYSPPWLVTRLRELGELGGALCAITGNPEPELLADLDGTRIVKARMRASPKRLSGSPTAFATGRSSPIRTQAGHRRCSASPTSSASGRRSARRFASTSPTRWPPRGTTSAGWSSGPTT